MATFYSDHFSSDGVNQTSFDGNEIRPSAGWGGGQLRYQRGSVTNGGLEADDIYKMLTLRSSDRIVEMYTSVAEYGTANIQYHSGSEPVGSGLRQMQIYAHRYNSYGEADENVLLGNLTAWGGVQLRGFEPIAVPPLRLAAVPPNGWGLPLWRLAAASGVGPPGSGRVYSSDDPVEQWDIVIPVDKLTLTLSNGGSWSVALEVFYTSED